MTRDTVRIELQLADGTQLARVWTRMEMHASPVVFTLLKDPWPSWLIDRTRFDDPSDYSITFKARVREGYEDQARALIEA